MEKGAEAIHIHLHKTSKHIHGLGPGFYWVCIHFPALCYNIVQGNLIVWTFHRILCWSLISRYLTNQPRKLGQWGEGGKYSKCSHKKQVHLVEEDHAMIQAPAPLVKRLDRGSG